ncbi:CsgG/HfaB family protein [Sporomusa sp. KB1]|uniref:CsgG/HfaB family protein n=1 Tax=Sporomusa sp. KB1 TaxID=943346 RepID=UPI0011A30F89|nr:CsgG/HfaB family protein [Sporomusa sp. KB1]TWH46898.1 Curli production assembly/transport component CsgG [Sporomusa sp. KB1]
MVRKGILGIILILVFITLSANIASAGANTSKKIGVLPLKNDSPYNQFGVMAAEMITADLVNLKSCTVVERTELSRVFAEQKRSAQGFIDEATATELGGILGLDYLLLGSANSNITKEPGHYYYNKKHQRNEWIEGTTTCNVTLTLKLVNVKNGQIAWSDQTAITNYNEDINTALSEAAYDSVRKIYKFIPLQGYVIKVEGGQYIIDLGTNDNVSTGDVLEVNGASNAIRHPVTGELMVMKRNIGELEVIEVLDTMCVTRLKTKDDGKEVRSSIQSGDAVIKKLRKKPRGFLGLGWSGKHVF